VALKERRKTNMKWGSKVLAFILGVAVLALTISAHIKWH